MSHMSSTPMRVNIPTGHWSVKQYVIAVALVLALVAGAFGTVYLLTGAEPASPAVVNDPHFVPGVGLLEDAPGSHGAGASSDVGGGLGESRATDGRIGGARGGIQP